MRRTVVATVGLALLLAACGGAQPQAQAPASGKAATPAAAQPSSPTLAAVQKKGQLDYGWATWYPYAYKDPDSNQVVGVAIDVAQNLAKSLGVKLNLVQDNWSTIVAGVQSNRFDLTMPLVPTPERSQALDFSAALMTNSYTALVRTPDAGKYPDLKSLDKPGVKIMVTLGANTDKAATAYFKQATIVRMQHEEDEPTALEANRADAMFSGNDDLTFVAKKYPNLTMLSGGIGNQLIAFGLRKGDAGFKQTLDKWVGQVKSDGELKSWIEKVGLTGAFVAP